MEKLKALFFKFFTKETILYVVFGVLTTLVNLVSFRLLDLLLGNELYLVTNVIAWIITITFSFLTNKAFVFESKDWSFKTLKKEAPAFAGARIASFFLEEGGLWFFVAVLHFDEKAFDLLVFRLDGKLAAKIILGVVVVVVNYLLSKFWIFRKKSD